MKALKSTLPLLLLLGGALIVASGACTENKPACDSNNCAGCCDTKGVCQLESDLTCGEGGLACFACDSSHVCQAGVCISASPTSTSTTTGTHSTSGTSGTTSAIGGTIGGTIASVSSSGGSGSTGVATNGTGSTGLNGSTGLVDGGENDGGELDAGIGDGGVVFFPDGGLVSCNFPPPQGGSCQPECNPGFHCEGGRCALNGGTGPVQVTLRWDLPEDLDLHVVEPSGCEIYYGNTNRPPGTSSCGAIGSLDLDSNPACNLDNVDTENVIYPAADGGGAPPPSGTYTVRVDFYDQCDQSAVVPYAVIVRANGTTTTYCNYFVLGDADYGSAGSGTTITTFTVP